MKNVSRLDDKTVRVPFTFDPRGADAQTTWSELVSSSKWSFHFIPNRHVTPITGIKSAYFELRAKTAKVATELEANLRAHPEESDGADAVRLVVEDHHMLAEISCWLQAPAGVGKGGVYTALLKQLSPDQWLYLYLAETRGPGQYGAKYFLDYELQRGVS